MSGMNSAKHHVPILECDICTDLADQAFESTTEAEVGKIAAKFLEHVINYHAGEVVSLLTEEYGRIFMKEGNALDKVTATGNTIKLQICTPCILYRIW